MPASSSWSFSDLATLFTDVVVAQQGCVQDTCRTDRGLFVRAVLPEMVDLVPGDRVQSGVALHASPDQVAVFPYVLRQVCTNGAVFPIIVEGNSLNLTNDLPIDQFETSFRELIVQCCQPSTFARSTGAMRESMKLTISHAHFRVLSVSLGRHQLGIRQRVMNEWQAARRRAFQERITARRLTVQSADSSVFLLMNAVTAVARDTEDPEAKWDLEKLGGTLAMLVPEEPHRPSGPLAARRSLDDESPQQSDLADELADRLAAVN